MTPEEMDREKRHQKISFLTTIFRLLEPDITKEWIDQMMIIVARIDKDAPLRILCTWILVNQIEKHGSRWRFKNWEHLVEQNWKNA